MMLKYICLFLSFFVFFYQLVAMDFKLIWSTRPLFASVFGLLVFISFLVAIIYIHLLSLLEFNYYHLHSDFYFDLFYLF